MCVCSIYNDLWHHGNRTFIVVFRADFFSEVKMMACLKDPNIVSLIGICSQDDPLCVVLEYMKHGDLNQFLQVHVAAESSLARNGNGPGQPKALRYGNGVSTTYAVVGKFYCQSRITRHHSQVIRRAATPPRQCCSSCEWSVVVKNSFRMRITEDFRVTCDWRVSIRIQSLSHLINILVAGQRGNQLIFSAILDFMLVPWRAFTLILQRFKQIVWPTGVN